MRLQTFLAAMCIAGAVLAGVSVIGLLPHSQGDSPTQLAGELQLAIDVDHPCGVVCVAVVLQLIGRPTPIDEVRKALDPDGLGQTSMKDVVQGLQALGAHALGVRLDPALLRSLAGVPLILYVDGRHFIVVLPTRSDSLVIFDHPSEVRRHPVQALSGRWDGEAIVVQTSSTSLAEVKAKLEI